MADDQITQYQAQKSLNLDPEKDQGDIMLPEPSPEQDILWNRLDEVIGEKELTRELAWIKTPPEIRHYLASSDVAKRIQRIMEKYKLSSTQAQELACLVRHVFIKEVDFKNVIVAVFENLKTDRETAKKIGEDVKLELFVPKRDYLLKLFGGETKEDTRPPVPPVHLSIPPQAPASPPSSAPTEKSAIPEKKDSVPPRIPKQSSPQPISTKSWEERFAAVIQPVDVPREKPITPPVQPAPILRRIPDVSPVAPKPAFTIDSVNKKPSQDMGKVIPDAPPRPAPVSPQPSRAPEPARFRSVPQYGLARTLQDLRDAEETGSPRGPVQPASPPSPAAGGGVQLDDLYNKVKSQNTASPKVPPSASLPLSSPSSGPETGNYMRTMKGDLQANQSSSKGK